MPEVKPIPDEYPGATPYLSVAGAAEAIEFYKRLSAPVRRCVCPRLREK